MSVLVRLVRSAAALLLVGSLTGCLPSGQNRSDEEKEPHFLAGKTCISSMDYRGAIDEFEKALEVNPHSASAHFQLGWLYEEKEPDPAAAIYHYEQYLKLEPGADNAEVIRQHINNCKQDLAKTVLPLPITPNMQRQFEQLADENKRLREEIDKWRAYASRLEALTNRAPPPLVSVRPEDAASAATSSVAPQQRSAAENHWPPGAGRTYTVKAGDSPYSIARTHGVKLEALMAANPGLDPRKLRIGQTLRLPSP